MAALGGRAGWAECNSASHGSPSLPSATSRPAESIRHSRPAASSRLWAPAPCWRRRTPVTAIGRSAACRAAGSASCSCSPSRKPPRSWLLSVSFCSSSRLQAGRRGPGRVAREAQQARQPGSKCNRWRQAGAGRLPQSSGAVAPRQHPPQAARVLHLELEAIATLAELAAALRQLATAREARGRAPWAGSAVCFRAPNQLRHAVAGNFSRHVGALHPVSHHRHTHQLVKGGRGAVRAAALGGLSRQRLRGALARGGGGRPAVLSQHGAARLAIRGRAGRWLSGPGGAQKQGER